MAFFLPLIAGIVTSAIGTGLNYALSSSPGQAPDYGAANWVAKQAEFDTLADRRKLEAAARLGTATDYQISGEKQPVYSEGYREARDSEGNVLYEYSKGPTGNVIAKPKMTWQRWVSGYETPTRTADFTGYGDADVQAKMAQDMAAGLLDTQQKYGVQMVEEAKKQLEQGDPAGTEARKKLYGMVMEDLNMPARDTRMTEAVRGQVMDDLATGGLGETARSAVGQTDAMGDTVNADAILSELGAGMAGQARRSAAQGNALGYLSSGTTAEDVRYRQSQQSMANAANFLSGQTPTSQFSNLSGAQQGATPQFGAPALPNVSNDQSAALGLMASNYASKVQQAADQVNPWFAGLSALMKGAGAFAPTGS